MIFDVRRASGVAYLSSRLPFQHVTSPKVVHDLSFTWYLDAHKHPTTPYTFHLPYQQALKVIIILLERTLLQIPLSPKSHPLEISPPPRET